MKKILAQAGIVAGATLLGGIAGALGAASVSKRAFKEFEKRAVDKANGEAIKRQAEYQAEYTKEMSDYLKGELKKLEDREEKIKEKEKELKTKEEELNSKKKGFWNK